MELITVCTLSTFDFAGGKMGSKWEQVKMEAHCCSFCCIFALLSKHMKRFERANFQVLIAFFVVQNFLRNICIVSEFLLFLRNVSLNSLTLSISARISLHWTFISYCKWRKSKKREREKESVESNDWHCLQTFRYMWRQKLAPNYSCLLSVWQLLPIQKINTSFGAKKVVVGVTCGHCEHSAKSMGACSHWKSIWNENQYLI